MKFLAFSLKFLFNSWMFADINLVAQFDISKRVVSHESNQRII